MSGYDSWESESWQTDGGYGNGGCEDPSAYGLVDISKGKGKGGKNNGWNSWDDGMPPLPGSAEVPRPPPGGNYKGGKGGWRSDSWGKGDSWGDSSYGKGGGGLSGKAPPSSGPFVPEISSKGKPGFSYKGKLAPRKADFNGKADFPAPRTVSPYQPYDSQATTPPSSVPVPPPAFIASKSQTVRPPASLDFASRGPVRPASVVAPRMPMSQGGMAKGVGVPPRVPLSGAPGAVRPPAFVSPGRVPPPGTTSPGFNAPTGFGGFGAASAPGLAPRSGVGNVMRPPPPQTRYVPPAPRPGAFGAQLPPVGALQPQVLAPGLSASMTKAQPALPAAPHTVFPQSSPSGLAPELAALVSAEGDQDSTSTRLSPLIPEKKPRIYLLVTKLAPELDEGQVQQVIEQCGEVQAFRRGRDADGKPLSFGFALFGDAEAAWKASTCLSKRILGGQEIKVLVEEHAETLIQQWRRSQQAALRVSTDEELDWELERKAVSCKASIDAKVEEIFGAPEDGSGAGAIAQRRQELRERERQRITRLKKRKAWREEEFAKELERVEAAEKRQRKEEVQKDDNDRGQEEAELKEKEATGGDQDLALSRTEDVNPSSRGKTSDRADNRKLMDMVNIVQSEARDDLFRMELNVAFLRDQKVLESKLRPWLERKVDLCMGGPQSDLVEYILRRVNASSLPDSLISELTRYLDDNAEPMVERMWRMLAFELMRGGYAFTDSMKKRDAAQKQGQGA